MNVNGKKVYVGLSGGVDSAVTAALLQKAGAVVTGVFIKGWYPPGMPCTWAADRRDAMRVAAHLRIPFETLDASEEYRTGVIEYLLREYKAGRTPNPDIFCNKEVKFGAFYSYAISKGADYIATGHYAQQEDGVLKRGIDASKDQSYFLWAVPTDALARTLFPLGALHKTQVRTLADSFALPNAQKKDSQGVCFLGSISIEDFLRQEFGTQEGNAITSDGTIVGRHDGVLLHTLGARIGLRDAAPGPWYVIEKDIEKNLLVVAHAVSERTQSSVSVEQTNLFTDIPATVSAQYRYHGPIVEGTYADSVFTPHVPIAEPIASGQSLVLYSGDVCIGGGIIT